jgi:hypothetical protein
MKELSGLLYPQDLETQEQPHQGFSGRKVYPGGSTVVIKRRGPEPTEKIRTITTFPNGDQHYEYPNGEVDFLPSGRKSGHMELRTELFGTPGRTYLFAGVEVIFVSDAGLPFDLILNKALPSVEAEKLLSDMGWEVELLP